MSHKTQKNLLIIAIVLVVGTLLTLVLQRSDLLLNNSAVIHDSSLDSPLNVSGLSYSNFQGDCLLSRVAVDTFRIQARSWSVFRLRSINEAVLQNAIFEFFTGCEEGETASTEGPFSMSEGLASSLSGLVKVRGVGRVTRALMDKMAIVNHRDGRPVFRIVARSGELDSQDKSMVFRDALLQHPPTGRSIRTAEVLWQEAQKLFYIPGAFVLRSSQGVEKHENAYLNLDFQLIRFQ